jgi:small subunit ribosomal protein S17
MGRRKEFIGTVIGDKMQKTAIVRVTLIAKHPKYGRVVRQYNKFKAHDEKKAAKVGDTVRIEETRPLSKDKRFRVVEIIKKAELPGIELKEEIK